MALTREEVLKIAKLSKLSFEDKEIEKFQVELNDILKYIDMLDEVDTSKVEPLVYINESVNNFREKEEKTSLEIEKVLFNAPESAENAIVVPKVIGE
ncbi:Asp-tRNA(Asn)/Glu-tRNA(Gln) amidotransferase subunit GatC [Fusobacterium nucleatum]|uniref:Asp-tRNA(Asn)/Glu-tRNA(Gln) amidotransferase subunit GatC n=1 Tax=Fusobacterium nucleatum TaxID=851 RepID=UPI0003B8D3FE|nr:Asp-tRNA(Asn)/Glu-tRNA(Gln) amidotransferase subunit GatC [Fusobacterium nucleatum]ALF24169.1 glutamyl-tRNA amidotransferase [Fusobacterium nucleatum subsp. nucleatum ChDC F316]ASG26538.1 Asp-tRNA(Asn)/Glu-tRNA(Gln) amidotransferase GatCAB subunit C [Fusobacterium nucleatum subsp. nucleatum]ERT42983.1 aspartyl/glutamyl-tRNA(Asn/Gln) amidotransferase subunit C [Fusobacterium nucleatum CTI-2]